MVDTYVSGAYGVIRVGSSPIFDILIVYLMYLWSYTLEIYLNIWYNIYMSNYDKLMRIVDKEVIKLKELQQITNDELVQEVKEISRDDKHKDLPKYDVRLKNGEIYYVYVKKSLFGF